MHKNLNKILLLCVALLMVFFIACGAEKDLNIFIASDIHYLDKDLYDDGEAFQKYTENSNGRNFLYIDEVVEAFSYEIENKKPDVLIISGDLTNNGEMNSHLKLAEKLKKLEGSSGTKVFVIPGNHDIDNPWARGFEGSKQILTDNISPEDFENIYQDYGYKEAISRDESTLSYLVAASDDLWLLMLDTNEYALNSELEMPTTNGVILDETQNWIEKCSNMANENNARIVTVMHHNLLKHSEMRYFGYTLDNYKKIQELYEKLGFDLNLSGHIHAQDIKSYDYENGTIYDVATGTMSAYPARYAVLTYEPNKGFKYDTRSVDVEKWARSTGQDNENLLNFNEYSKGLYAESAYKKAYDRLSNLESYSEEDKMEMSKTVAIINTARFGGNTETIKEEVLNSKGYELWVSASDDVPNKDRVMNIVNGNNDSSNVNNSDYNNNHLIIPIKK